MSFSQHADFEVKSSSLKEMRNFYFNERDQYIKNKSSQNGEIISIILGKAIAPTMNAIKVILIRRIS